jgi:hypothetical protein
VADGAFLSCWPGGAALPCPTGALPTVGEPELLVFTDWAADVCITIISIATDIGTAISLRIAFVSLRGGKWAGGPGKESGTL